MQIQETIIEGAYKIFNKSFSDQRGFFSKTFNFKIFEENSLNTNFKESFYSKSNKDVIRGMHIQITPRECSKLIYVSNGIILDVLIDLRKKSKTYKQFLVQELSDKNNISLYVPIGVAHGFLALEDNSIVNYLQSEVYVSECDAGIKWNSFGYDWNQTYSPIISDRDLNFPDLVKFKTPFL